MYRITLKEGETLDLIEQDHPEEQEMTIVYEKDDAHPLYPCCGCALENKPNLCTMLTCHRGYQYHEKMED